MTRSHPGIDPTVLRPMAAGAAAGAAVSAAMFLVLPMLHINLNLLLQPDLPTMPVELVYWAAPAMLGGLLMLARRPRWFGAGLVAGYFAFVGVTSVVHLVAVAFGAEVGF
ncbi:hypothetical protein JT358_00520 [Micrococcales bacterium 31B]|nr:hypothetical protein [Micrococcales bacterium 31B]